MPWHRQSVARRTAGDDSVMETDFCADADQEAEQSAAEVTEMQELLRTANCASSAPPVMSRSQPVAQDQVAGVTAEQYAMAHAAGYVAAKCRKIDASLGTPSAFADEKALHPFNHGI